MVVEDIVSIVHVRSARLGSYMYMYMHVFVLYTMGGMDDCLELSLFLPKRNVYVLINHKVKQMYAALVELL